MTMDLETPFASEGDFMAGVGMPQTLHLARFGRFLFEAFWHPSYQVGSFVYGYF